MHGQVSTAYAATEAPTLCKGSSVATLPVESDPKHVGGFLAEVVVKLGQGVQRVQHGLIRVVLDEGTSVADRVKYLFRLAALSGTVGLVGIGSSSGVHLAGGTLTGEVLVGVIRGPDDGFRTFRCARAGLDWILQRAVGLEGGQHVS